MKLMHQLLGGFPHEKRLADTIFTDTMKRFEKCTDEGRKEAETYWYGDSRTFCIPYQADH